MNEHGNLDDAVEVLQQLGLKEYEARCFVGLSRVHAGTAKQLSEITDVPRTRVYDAVRMLEAQGLVAIQHSSPQQFRAVSIEEATNTLRKQYEARVERLRDALDSVEIVDVDDESLVQQVWALSGRDAIENRANELILDATDEIVLVLGDESLLTEDLTASLNEVGNGIDLLVGALTDTVQDRIRSDVPVATTFISGLEWIHGGIEAEDEVSIGRLLLIDRSTILLSTIMPSSREELAVFGEGFGNGLVVIARRLMSQGLLTVRDPGQ